MKNILIPVGNTERTPRTLQYAIDFAAATKAQLYVMRAYKLPLKTGNLSNVNKVVQQNNKEILEGMVANADSKDVTIKVVTYKGDVIAGIKGFEKKYAIDLIVINSRSIDARPNVYLGSTTGSIVKDTESPVLIVHETQKFTPIKSLLTAFKSGNINGQDKKLNILKELTKIFKTNIELLLVKIPKHKAEDLEISTSLTNLTTKVSTTENDTTYQAVLEHLNQSTPDMLCVFRRRRGFFKKLWEHNTVLKKDFDTKIPLLVLKVNL